MKWIRIHYLDASAIIKLLIKEDGSDVLVQYFNSENSFHTTSLCFAETLGILKAKYSNKKKKIKEKNKENYLTASDELIGYINEQLINIDNIDITQEDIFIEVESLVQKHALDISDAFQIVTIKHCYFSQFDCDTKPILITADSYLAEVAKKEELRVWNCMNEPSPEAI